MRIPLVDLGWQNAVVATEVATGFARVLEATSFVMGDDVGAFESEFATFCGTASCVGVANGTDAIELMLRAVGIGAGDEVVLPVNTFIATALAVLRAGATPVFVDIDPQSYLIDVAQTASAIGKKTKALLPVHLYGQMAPMQRLSELASAANVLLLEDAAQAQGALQTGRGIGAWGAAAATSFYPGKNLGAYGDAGGVVTNSAAIDRSLRALRNYGSDTRYHHPLVGFNSRLDTLQAVVLRAKLQHLAQWNDARRRAAARYDALLAATPAALRPITLSGNEHVWHLYVIRVARRDAVLTKLQAAGVGAAIHYPLPLHMQGAMAHLGYKRGDFPIAEAAAEQILSLPLYPGITEEQQSYVVEQLRKALG